MERIAAEVYNWLRCHDMDPNQVTLMLRANDDRSLYRMEAALKMDLKPLSFDPKDFPLNLRAFKLHGIRCSLSSLSETPKDPPPA